MDWVKNVKATTNLKKHVQEELKNARIKYTDINDRDVVRRKIREWKVTLEEQRKDHEKSCQKRENSSTMKK